ncbi:MAG: adenylosuccinate lyase [Candidatus Eisenbacteria bacterium RBG_16_71_46]|nr:MAG: adenylosuccinate lyase [Candidatus Eisenbacteria bacterium RBG_16_71_46]OGF21163.1 MAG: adenylosuccinate lyase [Candidatus Eisenbacteria bacterium RBG_19FT_COMBO_70_11]
MIVRYARPEMRRIWDEERRLQLWLDVELAATAAREAHGGVPAGTADRIRARARLDRARMEAIEAEVRHDVIAFLSMVAETAGDDARHLHVGLTSSDLVDTALACQIAAAGRVLGAAGQRLRRAAFGLAERHRSTPMVGRTHGVHAEPITFGLKCLVWCEELGRDLARLEHALEECAVGKFSGAVGTLAHLDPEVETAALARLGLRPEPVASQVVQRDRHAFLMAVLAVLGGTMEKIALELRHLQRSEVREAEEPFAEGQKGSSAMPHKRNPVRCERVCGMARLLRGYAQAALENQALWHERDISHSSVERVILPDAFLIADFMAVELADVLEDLRVYPEAMRRNLEAGGGLVFSQRVLLALTEAGVPRDEAYGIVQEHALRALDGGGGFQQGLAADPRVARVLSRQQLDACFSLDHFLRHVDAIYARAARPAS